MPVACTRLSRRHALLSASAAMALAACSPSGPQLIASTTVNGRTIKVFATGGASHSSGLAQSGGATRLTLGSREVVVHPDGRVSVDGVETAHGPFTELHVTVSGDGRIEVKVVR